MPRLDLWSSVIKYTSRQAFRAGTHVPNLGVCPQNRLVQISLKRTRDDVHSHLQPPLMEMSRHVRNVEHAVIVYDSAVLITIAAYRPARVQAAVGVVCRAELAGEDVALGRGVGLVELERWVGGWVGLDAEGVPASRGRGESIWSFGVLEDFEGGGGLAECRKGDGGQDGGDHVVVLYVVGQICQLQGELSWS